jgi:Zn-finger nucleic acid-binding protein
VAAHDSSIIRCSACGGSRAGSADVCTYCGASFTMRERQLADMCPACGARASGGDHYCRACGAVILGSDQAARPGAKQCPVCAERHTLSHRQLHDVALLECVHCGGVWLDRQAFATLATQAREHALRTGAGTPQLARSIAAQPGPAYRRCIECDILMLRKNYGRKSGVIVDVCPKHGIWFDLHELEQVLGWLRAGGIEAPEPRAVERPAAHPSAMTSSLAQPQSTDTNFADVVDFVSELFDLFV